jgi:hypothetical protein
MTLKLNKTLKSQAHNWMFSGRPPLPPGVQGRGGGQKRRTPQESRSTNISLVKEN